MVIIIQHFFFHLYDNKLPIFLDPYGIPIKFNNNGSASFKSTVSENGTHAVREPSLAFHICNVIHTN